MANIQKLVARGDAVLEHVPKSGAFAMVEVGVFVGDLACYLLERRPELVWVGIDSWAPTEQQPEAYRLTGDVHAAASGEHQAIWEAQARRRLARYGERARIIRERSPMAARQFEDGSLDIVFLDAQHDHAGVLADCRGWWPKVRPGGWLGGHDMLSSDRRFTFGVNEAVNEFSLEVGVAFEIGGGTCWFMRKP